MTRDEILTSIAVMILLFTAMVNWNVYSWLLLLAIIVVLAAWYFRSSRGSPMPKRESARRVDDLTPSSGH